MTVPTIDHPQPRTSRRRSWALAGVAATAFVSQPQFAGVKRLPLRVLFWVQFGLGDYRAHDAAAAVCALSGASRRPKVHGTVASVAGAVVLAGLWWTAAVTWPVLAAMVLLAGLYLPMVQRSLAGIGARRQLVRARPAGRVVIVHTVASVVPGAGAALLRTVVAEADRKQWTLALDAANPRLARYYGRFGFEATAGPVLMSSGEAAVPMARAPRFGDEASSGSST